MNEARTNPRAVAKRAGGQMVPVLDIGEGYAIAGLTLEPLLNPKGDLCAVLSLVAGKLSDIVGFTPVKLPLGELAVLPMEKVRELIAAAIEQQSAVEQ